MADGEIRVEKRAVSHPSRRSPRNSWWRRWVLVLYGFLAAGPTWAGQPGGKEGGDDHNKSMTIIINVDKFHGLEEAARKYPDITPRLKEIMNGERALGNNDRAFPKASRVPSRPRTWAKAFDASAPLIDMGQALALTGGVGGVDKPVCFLLDTLCGPSRFSEALFNARGPDQDGPFELIVAGRQLTLKDPLRMDQGLALEFQALWPDGLKGALFGGVLGTRPLFEENGLVLDLPARRLEWTKPSTSSSKGTSSSSDRLLESLDIGKEAGWAGDLILLSGRFEGQKAASFVLDVRFQGGLGVFPPAKPGVGHEGVLSLGGVKAFLPVRLLPDATVLLGDRVGEGSSSNSPIAGLIGLEFLRQGRLTLEISQAKAHFELCQPKERHEAKPETPGVIEEE